MFSYKKKIQRLKTQNTLEMQKPNSDTVIYYLKDAVGLTLYS